MTKRKPDSERVRNNVDGTMLPLPLCFHLWADHRCGLPEGHMLKPHTCDCGVTEEGQREQATTSGGAQVGWSTPSTGEEG